MPTPTDDSRATPETCLQLRYQERLKELAKVAYKLGPFVFNRIDLFAAEPHDASDETGSVPGFYIQHLAFPQIDNVNSAAVAAWNRTNDRGSVNHDSSCDSDSGDEDQDYDVGYANNYIISVERVVLEYCHGTSHGMFSVTTDNLVWGPPEQKLIASEVFSDGWEAKFKKLFLQALAAKDWSPPENQTDTVRDEIGSIIVDPTRWYFTKAGLSISFSAYEGGCYACNPGTTTVRWNDLKPLLAACSIFSEKGGKLLSSKPTATKPTPYGDTTIPSRG